MNNVIKISVIIPVYNVQNYIKECLDSLVSQITPKIEPYIDVILINDGSNDNSREICTVSVINIAVIN